jgi:hypothetical protein
MAARGWLVATAATIVVVASIAAAIVALRGGVAAPAFAAGSAEAVVSEFVQAVIARDTATARSLLTPAARSRCSADAFARGVESETRGFGLSAPRFSFVLVERRELPSASVQLRVRILRTEVSPPWESVTDRREGRFVLEPGSDGYRIASFDWPGACW